jgi:CheY-like chemotaxis protein
MALLWQLEISVKEGVQILVVDDEPLIRHSMKMLLEHDGHKVCAVESGEAALELLAQRRFDLIITDFSMPGMYGDQLVACIRASLPDQPIIMATAFVEEYKIFGDVSAFPDALLLKPFSLKELREAIEQVLPQEQSDQTSDLPPIIKPSLRPEVPPPKQKLN